MGDLLGLGTGLGDQYMPSGQKVMAADHAVCPHSSAAPAWGSVEPDAASRARDFGSVAITRVSSLNTDADSPTGSTRKAVAILT